MQSVRELRSKGWRSPDLQSERTGIRALSPLRRLRQGPTYSPNRLVSQSAKLKELSVQGCKRADTSVMFCQSITQILKIIWVRCIPLSLRSKTRRRTTPLLPTLIYSCRLRVTVSCALPFTTNVKISTSTSQISVPEKQYSIFASLWRFYLTAHTVCQGLLLSWMLYSKCGATFI